MCTSRETGTGRSGHQTPSVLPKLGLAALGSSPDFFPSVVQRLRLRGIEQIFRPGQVISYEGHRPLGIYLHERGRLDFLVEDRRIGSCSAPCLLGVESLMEDSELPFTTRAAVDACLVFVSRAAWKDIIQRNSDEGENLTRKLG